MIKEVSVVVEVEKIVFKVQPPATAAYMPGQGIATSALLPAPPEGKPLSVARHGSGNMQWPL